MVYLSARSSDFGGAVSLPSSVAQLGSSRRIRRLASWSEREETSAELLERLSRNFDLCAYGLREIRREWERRDDDDEPPRPLLIG